MHHTASSKGADPAHTPLSFGKGPFSSALLETTVNLTGDDVAAFWRRLERILPFLHPKTPIFGLI